MQDDRVVRGAGGIDQFQLRRMGEHGLGDERCAELDELGPGLRRHPRGLIRMRGHIIGPALFGDLVGVDEGAAGQQRRQRELDELDFPAPLGPTTRSSRFIGWARRRPSCVAALGVSRSA